MLSQTAEYALRSVVCLATYPDTPLTTPQIAKVTKVPASYLSKVLQALGKGGIVRSQRGLHGGFTLAREPGHLNLLEVINAVDPVQRIERCPLDLNAHGTNLCPLHKRINDAHALIENAFQETTIAELLNQPTQSKPLCSLDASG